MARGFKSLLDLEAARDRLLDVADPVDRRTSIPLADAADRVLAEPVDAPIDLPREDRAAMDGYAVRAEDTRGASDRAPVTLEVGEDPGPETAARVHTGSPLPEGADAVVMVEEATPSGDDLAVHRSVPVGRHVADRGEDVQAGDRVLDAGHRLRPSDMGLLRALEVETVPVVDRPSVAVVPTGDEIVDADPGPGESIESNGITVATSLARWGADPQRHDIVPDDPEALAEAIQTPDADVVATLGGTSVGERDHLPDVLDELGDRLFHGVAVRPGHPVGAWSVDGRPVVTLPGYPVACLVTATLLLRGLIRTIGRRSAAPDPHVEARLARKVPSKVGDLHVVRVRLDEDDDGPVADPTRSKGAGVISSVTAADGVVLVPPKREGLDTGETVEVVIWE